jgi:hypothetical protein
MSSIALSNINQLSPLEEQAAIAVVKQLVEQGRAKEVVGVLKKNPAGKIVLKRALPGPEKAIAVLSGFTDSPLDNTYGYILYNDDTKWLFTIFEQGNETGFEDNDLVPGNDHKLGGVVLHCEDKEAVADILISAIRELDKDQFDRVKDGLSIAIDEDAEQEGDGEESEGDTENVFDHGLWIDENNDGLKEAILNELDEINEGSRMASRDTVDALMRDNRGIVVVGTIIIDNNSWN